MATLGDLVDALPRGRVAVVVDASAGKSIVGVRVIEELGDVEQPCDGLLVVLSRAASAAAQGHRLDIILSRAGSRGAAGVCVYMPDDWSPSLTVGDIAARYGLGVLSVSPTLGLSELVLTAGRAVAGGSEEALARLDVLMGVLHSPPSSQTELLAAAGDALRVSLTIAGDESAGAALSVPIVVAGSTVGHLCVAGAESQGDSPTSSTIASTRAGLRLIAEVVARMREEEARRRDLPIRSTEHVLSELLVSSRAETPDLVRRARDLGVLVDGWHIAVRLELEESEKSELERFELSEALMRTALRAARAAGGVWHSARAPDAVLLFRIWPEQPDANSIGQVRAAVQRALEAVESQHSGAVAAGVGTPHDGYLGLRASADEARLALQHAKLARPDQRLALFDASGLRRMLIDWSSSTWAQETARNQLAPLKALGAERERVAIQTLQAYLDNQGSIAATANALHLHRNAIRYRLGWILEALDADLGDPDQRLVLHLACRLWQLS